MIAAWMVRGVKWSLWLALVHYACVWLSIVGWFMVFGHIDDQRTATRQGVALALNRAHDVLLEPLGRSSPEESALVAHSRMLLNSLLWGSVTGTLLLLLSSYRRPRAVSTRGASSTTAHPTQ